MTFARILTAALFLSLIVPMVASAREMDSYPVVKLQSLDKITARTMTFEANVGNTVKFGSLYIKVQACRKAPPIEQPESAAFLQIWEVKSSADKEGDVGKKDAPKEDAQWIFSGWMFASSPALSHMDHPVYDVWVLDCLSEKTGAKKEETVTQDNDGAIEDLGTSKEGNAAVKTTPEAKTPDTKSAPAPAAPATGEPARDDENLSPLGD